MNSHIFTNKNGNTLMREFEGVLSNNSSIKNLDAVVGFFQMVKDLADEKLYARVRKKHLRFLVSA